MVEIKNEEARSTAALQMIRPTLLTTKAFGAFCKVRREFLSSISAYCAGPCHTPLPQKHLVKQLAAKRVKHNPSADQSLKINPMSI